MGKKEKAAVKDDKKSETRTKELKVSGYPSCCRVVTSVVVVLLAVLSYKVYQYVEFVPDMPAIDVDEWWGPNNTRLTQDRSIRPFRIVFSEAMDTDIRKRFELYRQIIKPKTFKDAGWTYGVNSEGFGQFFAYWIFNYNFREREKFLNQFEHFKTNIQGLDIHYVHVKPKVDKNIKVLPLLLLHGWPGSFREFYEAIPLLTTPRPGNDFVFEVIVPSLPGYGYSQGAVRRGLSAAKVGVIMRNLMKRLGFIHYYVQGGDMGYFVGSSMATIFPKEIAGFHTNMAYVVTRLSTLIWVLGGLWSAFEGLVEDKHKERLYPLVDKVEFYLEESGYFHMHSTKPDTWGVALHESPAGLAGYILEKFVSATNYEGRLTEDGGLDDVYSKDALLDNIMIYWATGCITTSMRLYAENVANFDLEKAIAMNPTKVPTWTLQLKNEILYMPSWLLKLIKYPNLLGTTSLDEGGHFAALEKPKIFADDVFKAAKRFQEFNRKK